MFRAMQDGRQDRLRTALFAGTFIALVIVLGLMVVVMLRLVFVKG
jgi:hypothetical protein